MLNVLRMSALTVATLTAVALAMTPKQTEAQSYQIDCAILLCLSGGWPASVPCARARAEFIRRITPWPVEPPLQIWRCPMGAAYPVDPDVLTSERIYEILFERYPVVKPLFGKRNAAEVQQQEAVRHHHLAPVVTEDEDAPQGRGGIQQDAVSAALGARQVQ